MEESTPAPTQPPQHQPKRPRVAEENRKRAVRACDGCRRVKEKCEGGVPCRRCLRYRRQCIFTHIDPTEKTRSASVSLLDRAASINRHDIQEAERVRCMERILSHYVPNITFDLQSLRQVAEEVKGKHRDSESDVLSTRADGNELEDLAIDEEDFTIKALPNNTTQYSGEFSYLNFSNKIRQKIDEWMKTAAPEATTEVEPFEERWRATQLQSGSSLISSSVTCLPPRYVADFLVQIFFKYAQTNNFYVEEDWLRQKMAICYTNPAELSTDDAGAVCALLMVLAVGTQFAHMESTTPVNRQPPTTTTDLDHHFSEDEVGLTFYQFASKLLPDIIATASVRSVQACLLIGTYLLPLDTSGLCYTYFGLALKLAIQNGMHRKYHGEGLSARMIETRNRVFWTAYTIEKRISILHGRPASLADTDVDAPLPVDFPGIMPATQQSNHTNMVALITLTLKLGEVSHEISSLRTCRKGQQDCLERLLNLRKLLIEWWSSLPEETSCRDLNPAGPLFRSNVHLKLDYCLTRIFIGRPFLFSNMKGLQQASSHPPSTSNVGPSKASSGVAKNRATLVTDCVEAALEIIDLCRLLRDETGLARASFTEFSSCRAALLVILAQGLTKRTERLGAALDQGISLIKIMSMGVGSARSAVSVIEALERAIRRLEIWSETHQSQSNGGSAESAYDRFKNWEMLWKTGPVSPSTLALKQEIFSANEAALAQGIAHPESEISSTDPAIAGTPSVLNASSVHESHPYMGSHGQEIIEGDIPGGISIPDSYNIPHSSLSQMPHLGFDHFVSNFPQELGEFTAIPCFETDTQGTMTGLPIGTEMKTPGSTDSQWMQFMNE
ncbi:Fungal specific transcription factor involved in L-proline catabolism [Penicillium ucsense]|uniref:Fungal specific transcription factor involved in L-proline catabolism n=1 Tax=Penicillium ucsense TaxID=2839758 RepID=A0A8J8W447_9EURO|nr:Fungal specific transcription factor involved in L-proline catabolism [Penicillium ucsense]KAF7732178.1 Fungal specific transcription factor involved in L-proline catabolism [Penicillium ucsense]